MADDGDLVLQCTSNVVGVAQQAWLRRASDGSYFRLSSTSANGDGNGPSGDVTDLSRNADVVAFDSSASNLDPGDGNSGADVFVAIEDVILYAIFADGFE